MIKFPTEYGIGELRGDQVATRECYIAMLEFEDYQQTMYIGEQWTAAESVEKSEEIILNESRPKRRTRMGTLAVDTSRPNKFPKDESGCIHVESRRHASDRLIGYSPQTEC